MGFGQTTTKGRRYPIEVLSAAEVRALMNGCSMRGACGARDRALIAIMYRGGLRIAEALALAVRDVTLEDGTVNVRCGKGGKQRFVAVDDETVGMITRWLTIRRRRGISEASPLFCTLDGGQIDQPQVRRKLKKLAARAGIQKRVHPHGLRHARAVDLVKNGVALPTIQAAYGHTSLQTTQTYVSHLAPADVMAAMKGGSW